MRKQKDVNVRIGQGDYKRLKEIADREGRTIKKQFGQILTEYDFSRAARNL